MTTINCSTFKSSKGGLKLSVNGYIYNKNREVKNKVYWICERRGEKCMCRAITTINMEMQLHTVIKCDENHNHDPEPARLAVASIIDKIKSDSYQNTGKKTCQILQTAKSSSDELILSELPSTSALRQVVYREKKKGKPNVIEPTDIYFQIHHDELQIQNNNFVICDEIFDDNKRIIIFSCPKMIDFFGRSKLLIMDGTFYIAAMNFLQLYVIHGNIFEENTHTYPLLFALCTHKDKKTYNKLFDLIITYCNEHEITITVTNVIMDFELIAMKCVKQNFDNVTVNGCFFHLAQSLYRRIQRAGKAVIYGTNNNFAIEMKCLLALAFLDEKEIPHYFMKLQESVSSESIDLVQMFGKDYVLGNGKNDPCFSPKLWSIASLQDKGLPRTQNSAESWHHRINKIVNHKNPGFYCLAHELLLESKVILGDVECLFNGQSPPKKTKKCLKTKERIDNILKKKKEYTEIEFLRALASNLKLK